MRFMLFGGGRKKPVPGFLGEVLAADFINGVDLAAAIGLTAGNSLNPTSPWLKFIDPVDLKTKYIPKRPLRNNISWSNLSNAGAVFGGKTVVIDGKTYVVRLFKGAGADPSTAVDSSSDHLGTHGSEWNRLMYRIVANAGLSGEGIQYGEWAQYTAAELVFGGAAGSATWCQETGAGGYSPKKTQRGYGSLTHLTYISPSGTHTAYGWRPVLELVG